jgi:hypothetical protein
VTDLNVKPQELLASAHMTETVNSPALHSRITGALSAMEDAAQALGSWSIQPEMDALGSTWGLAFKGLQGRLTASADALRGCATTHAWNDTLLGRDFEGL